jgi:hypothetical protein
MGGAKISTHDPIDIDWGCDANREIRRLYPLVTGAILLSGAKQIADSAITSL